MLRGLIHAKPTLKPNNRSLIDSGFKVRIFQFHSKEDFDFEKEGFYREYSKKRKKSEKLPPLDPFKLDKFERKESVKENFDGSIPLNLIESMNSFSILPNQVMRSALGNNEQRVTDISMIVKEFSNKISSLDNIELFRVLLLRFSVVNIDVDKLKSTIQILIENGINPARMLELQPTVICIDVNMLAQNLKSLLRIIEPNFEEIKFNRTIFQELNKLSSFANRCNTECKGAELVERLYQSGRKRNLSNFRIYKRVFEAIKLTSLSDKSTDSDVYNLCCVVYKRLFRAEITQLCSEHFKEIALGFTDEFQTDLNSLRGIGLQNNSWVGKFLKTISVSKILLRDISIVHQLGPKLTLLEGYGIDVNKLNLFQKCPKLLNSSESDITRSMAILKSSPFYCNRTNISRVLARDPSIFTIPEVLESTRKELELIPLLKHRQIDWHVLIKRCPNVLTIKNYSRIFDVQENHGFSKDEIITSLEYYPSIIKFIENKIDELDRNSSPLKPHLTKIAPSTKIRLIKERIEQETLYRYSGYTKAEPISGEVTDMAGDGKDGKDISKETDRDFEYFDDDNDDN
ncbi:hypothetical protein LOD99_367 [Oopsacas minuta]|uniref:Uncharacterized protein n=1 Tax=Oopsacas minuta TaxID=111878 RepID=A0AAV7KAF1_9METZ|nr:hypothetical protein LOD99_367 [Oopsacas minuta]